MFKIYPIKIVNKIAYIIKECIISSIILKYKNIRFSVDYKIQNATHIV